MLWGSYSEGVLNFNHFPLYQDLAGNRTHPQFKDRDKFLKITV